MVDIIKDLHIESEVYDIIEQLGELQDDHDYIEKIAVKLGVDKRAASEDIIREIKDCDAWINYVQPIKEWLEDRKQRLNLEIPN